jgi:transposase-like protein
MTLRYCDLSEPQRRVITNLARAEIADPPGWIVTKPRMNRCTVRKLTALDLIVVSHDDDALRARITRRGMDYYYRILCAGRSIPRYSDAQIKEIAQAASEGEPYTAIADRIGCSPGLISQIMRGCNPRYQSILTQLGIDARKAKAQHSKAERHQAIEMRQAGASYQEIRAALDIGYGTLGNWFRQAGLITEGWLSDETRQQIIRLTREGYTYQQIADHLRCSTHPVFDTLRAYYRGEVREGM